MISGNFRAYTHAFRLVTDDAALIARISAAVQRNKARPEYQEARRKMIDDLPALTFKNAAVGHYYRFCDGWFRLTKIIHLTEEDCNRDSLLYMDRYEGTDWNGHAIGGAFHDGREMPTSANWSIYAAPKENCRHRRPPRPRIPSRRCPPALHRTARRLLQHRRRGRNPAYRPHHPRRNGRRRHRRLCCRCRPPRRPHRPQ